MQVIAVWMPLVSGDARAKWDPDLLADARVSYFWDEERVTGRWFSEYISGQKPLAWDAYFLYGPDATWDDIPGPLVSTGYTIMDAVGQLGADMAMLLEP